MCENLNIDVKHKAADSPTQNALCKKNNAVIDSMVTIMIEDNKIFSIDIVLVWAIHVKKMFAYEF